MALSRFAAALVVLVALLPWPGLASAPYLLGPAAQLYVVVETIRPGGACTPPNGDNGAYTLHGWKLASTLSYRINHGSVPSYLNKDAALTAIQGAASQWDDNTAASLFAYGGTTAVKAGKRDGVNAVSFGGAPYGSIAVAYIWASGGIVREVDMSLGAGWKWATGSETAQGACGGADDRMDIGDIATHEFGHWVGAGHTSTNSANNAQSMFPYASYEELFKQSLADGDKAALAAIYG